jgi:two-component system, NtrC family, sensor kinase
MRPAPRLLPKRSILFTLYIAILPIIILAIVLVGYLDARLSSRMIDTELEQSTERMAAQLAQDLSRPDAPASADSVKNLLLDPEESNYFVARIDVFHLTGDGLTLFASTSSNPAQPITIDEMTAIRETRTITVPFFKDRARFLKVIVPIVKTTGTIGCVSVTTSLQESELVSTINTRIALILIPTTIVGFVLSLHFLFTRVVTGRINRLILAMNEARSGNLGRRAAEERDDELGIISRRFNEMMDEIERTSLQRDALLKEHQDFNAQLRVRVSEATREIHAANERLRQANQDLVDTQQRLMELERVAVAGQMAATFAHEIGSPLSAISTHLELMAEDSSTAESARKRLGLIQEQVTRITGFVEQMLAETQRSRQSRNPVQINQLLQQILLFLEQHLERNQVRVETDFSDKQPEIQASPQQLQQVFINLFNNACDAMPDGGVIRIATSVETDAGGEFVVVSVADTGTGIPEEKQARIFEPFFTTKDLGRGTGLGLSIAANIIRQHKGTIELQSKERAGTKFTIRFPASVSAAAS